MSRGKRSLPAAIFFYLGIAAMLAFLLFPFYWTFVTSVSPRASSTARRSPTGPRPSRSIHTASFSRISIS